MKTLLSEMFKTRFLLDYTNEKIKIIKEFPFTYTHALSFFILRQNVSENRKKDFFLFFEKLNQESLKRF